MGDGKKDDRQPRRRMPPMQFGADLPLWTAWLYYEERLKQDEIAARLGISRASVFNLLQKAREDGIVTITIDPTRLERADLSMALKERCGLDECFVLPASGTGAPVHERLGRLAARILEQKLADDDVIGVAWGRTVMALSQALAPAHMPGATVAQVTGSSIATYDFSPELCTSNIAARLNARCVNLHAPGVVSNARMKALLMQEPIVEQHFALLRQCTKTLFGATPLTGPTLLEDSGVMTDTVLREYLDAGGVGFASGYVFDEAGRIIRTGFDDRHLVMPLEDFLSVPDRICVAGGPAKIPALEAMIRARIATILITDQDTARALAERFPG
ncbi:sugar-binding transcriptional regulator [Rhizobium sp. SG2393]|uniref:sugar-binding transcriptional regulator n=1 Tax=Rhizobium sp. SG2393 TaxID=3276279 RepID=UPI003670F32B